MTNTPADILTRAVSLFPRAERKGINSSRYDHNGYRIAFPSLPDGLNADGTVKRWGFLWIFRLTDNKQVFAAEAKQPGGKLIIDFCEPGDWRAEFMRDD